MKFKTVIFLMSITATVLTGTAHAENCRADGLGGYRCDNGNSIIVALNFGRILNKSN